MSSSLQIKPLLEDTVREYSRIKGVFENAAALNQFRDDPALIRSVEGIFENLRKIREEVSRFQESLPPPSEDFTQTYHPPEEHASMGSSGAAADVASANWVPLPESQCHCIHCGNPVAFGSDTETHQVNCAKCGKSFIYPADPKEPPYESALSFLPKTVLRHICEVSGRHSGSYLAIASLAAFLYFTFLEAVLKFHWKIIKVDYTHPFICYFALIGVLLPLCTWRKRIFICPTCGNKGMVTPFLLNYRERVRCSMCNELFPLPREWFLYRTWKFFFVIFPFYFLFFLMGTSCWTVLAFVLLNFIVSYLIQVTLCHSR